MQNSFLGAYRAVAIGHAIEVGGDPEPHAAAMAAALHRPEHGRRPSDYLAAALSI